MTVDCYQTRFFVVLTFSWLIVSLIFSTSAICCLERLGSKMTCYVFRGMVNPAHLLTYLFTNLCTGG